VISLDSAHEHLAKMRPANIQLWYNPVKSREPKPSQTPIIIADEKTHEETPMKQELKRKNALTAPEKDPCQAWLSSWAAGLESVSDWWRAMAVKNVLW
jgi:hypothetical protein